MQVKMETQEFLFIFIESYNYKKYNSKSVNIEMNELTLIVLIVKITNHFIDGIKQHKWAHSTRRRSYERQHPSLAM